MRFNRRILVLALLFSGISNGSQVAAMQVEVFVAPHQVERIQGQAAVQRIDPTVTIEVFDLGAPERLEERLSMDLPSDPVLAERMLSERLQLLDLEAESFSAFAGILRAAELGLDRLPAMVFDARAIVYGVFDLTRAYGLYRGWLDAQD